MKTTVKDIERITGTINKFFGFNKFEIGKRNGYIYFDYADHSKDALFNSATTTKEMYLCLVAFLEGLRQSKEFLNS